jgi:hypothetical protein
MKKGDVVYHVANHKVRGTVMEENNIREDILVCFDTPVSFEERQQYRQMWFCSKNLLYSTPEEAKTNHICQADPCWHCTLRHIKDIIE